MFYELLKAIAPDVATETLWRVFGYTTVRSACALFSAFIFSLLFGPLVIRRLTQLKLGQQVREFKTAETAQFNIHQHKAGTPTMGGILILLATFVSVVLFCDPGNSYVWVATIATLAGGAIGFADDFYKISRRNHKGCSAKQKLGVQCAIGVFVGLFLLFTSSTVSYAWTGDQGADHLLIPFLKDVYPALGALIVPWAVLVLAGTSNAVNLTDGLDGLAIGTVIVASLPYVAICYLVSRVDFAPYLYVPYIPQAAELTVFLGALLGASLGFLWFNAHPAQMFMGDTGSLSIGTAVGTVALLCKHEIILVLIGGVFVIEALSVMVQVTGYKLTGNRVLRMSPLHNHYVKLGIDEEKIIARFIIVATLLALIGLGTLKLR